MTSNILGVLGLAFLPALGNFGGGVLAEWLHPSQKMLNRALHTGIIIAIIAVEVMPEALEKKRKKCVSLIVGDCWP